MAAHFLTDEDRADLAEMLTAFRAGRLFSNGERIDSRRALGAVEEIAIAKTTGAISPEGSGSATRWTVTGGAFAATSPAQTLTVYDWAGGGIATDTKVTLLRVQHKNGTRWVNANAQDIFVAIEAGNTTGYLKDQVEIFNVTPQYTANQDFIIESETTGSTPNKKLRQFIQSGTYLGYNIGAAQTLGKNSSNNIEWATWSGHSPWIVVVNSSNNWAVTHAGPQSGETTTTVPATDPSLLSGSPNAESHNWTTSAFAGAHILVSRVYQSAPGGNVDLFFRTVTADTLGHSWLISGETIWANAIVMPTFTDNDKRVAVVSTSTPGYIENIWTGWLGAPAFEIGNDYAISAEQSGNEFIPFLDHSTIPAYNSANQQVLGHDDDATAIWFAWPPTSIDEKVKVTSADDVASYLNDKIVDDTYWIDTEIVNAGFDEDLRIKHIGPRNDETTTIIGTDDEKASTTPDSTALDLTATTNAGAFWYMAAFYQQTTNDDVNFYFRKASVDSLGHLHAVSGESAARVVTLNHEDVKVKVTSADTTTDYLNEKVAATAVDGTADWIDKDVLNAGANEDLRIKHVGPKSESAGTAVTSAVSGTDIIAENDSFTATGSNHVEFTFVTRVAYDQTDNKFVRFVRTMKFDRKGHLYSISVESGPTDIIDLQDCTTI